MIVWPTVHELQRVGPFSPLPSCISITYTVLCKAKCSKGPLHTSRWKVPSSSDDILPFPLIDILTQWPDHMERWHCREVGWSSVSILIIYAGQKGMKKPARLRICIPVKKIFRLPQWGHSSYISIGSPTKNGTEEKEKMSGKLCWIKILIFYYEHCTILFYTTIFSSFFLAPVSSLIFFYFFPYSFLYTSSILFLPPPPPHTLGLVGVAFWN